MMGYGNGGSGWIWMVIGVFVLIGVVVRAVIAMTNRSHGDQAAPTASVAPDGGGRARARQVLDERYASGEITSDEYTERLHTLGL